MTQSLSSTAIIERAMSVAAFRQKLLANNVANVDTPGYKRFDIALEQAILAKSERAREQTVYQETASSLRVDGNNVDVEQEMANIAENSLYFDALTLALNKQLSTMRYLITEGRR